MGAPPARRAALSSPRADTKRGALSFLPFRFFPIAVQFVEGQCGIGAYPRSPARPSAMTFLDAGFDVRKASFELVDRSSQRGLGVEIDVTRQIDEREKHVPQLAFDASLVTGGNGAVELADFLGDFGA